MIKMIFAFHQPEQNNYHFCYLEQRKHNSTLSATDTGTPASQRIRGTCEIGGSTCYLTQKQELLKGRLSGIADKVHNSAHGLDEGLHNSLKEGGCNSLVLGPG